MDFGELNRILDSVIHRGVPSSYSAGELKGTKRRRRARESTATDDLSSELSDEEYLYRDVNWDRFYRDGEDSGEGESEQGKSYESDELPEESESEYLESLELQELWQIETTSPEGETVESKLVEKRESYEKLPEGEFLEPVLETTQGNEEIMEPDETTLSGHQLLSCEFSAQPLLMSPEEYYGSSLEVMLQEAESNSQEEGPQRVSDPDLRGIRLEGDEKFKLDMKSILDKLSRQVMRKLSGLTVVQDNKSYIELDRFTLHIKPGEDRAVIYALLAVALDKGLAQEGLSSFRSPVIRRGYSMALKNQVDSGFIFPSQVYDELNYFAWGVAGFMDTAEEEGLSRDNLIRRARNLYDYLKHLTGMSGLE